MARKFYPERVGSGYFGQRLDIVSAVRFLTKVVTFYLEEGYFFNRIQGKQEQKSDRLGDEMEIALLKSKIWPMNVHGERYDEPTLFGVIEFLHYQLCPQVNQHAFESLVKVAEQFRLKANGILKQYGDGFELTTSGEICHLPMSGAEKLLDTPLPDADKTNVQDKIEEAKKKFFLGRSTPEDRRHAIRELADVLEYLKKKGNIESVLANRDETELFHLANQFGVRHHDGNQKDKYDKDIWYDWMFYYYLNTIHAALRLLNRKKIDS